MKAMRHLTLLCGVLCAVATAAHAQSPKIGTVLAVPTSDLALFRLANASLGVDSLGQRVPANDVTVLHTSGPVTTVSLTVRGTNQKAWRVFFPKATDGTLPGIYRGLNANDFITNPRTVGSNFVQMDVRQPDTGNVELESVRFLLVPSDSGVFALQFANPQARFSRIHLQKMPTGSGFTWVELVGIDQDSAEHLKFPTGDLARQIQALNSNVSIDFSSLDDLKEAHLGNVR
jgi:hypothetical protein